jgi:hypothetical protein
MIRIFRVNNPNTIMYREHIIIPGNTIHVKAQVTHGYRQRKTGFNNRRYQLSEQQLVESGISLLILRTVNHLAHPF